MSIDLQQLLTSSEVADLLQVNRSSVKNWVDEGLLRAFRTPGGHRRIRAADLLAFLNKQNIPVPAPLQDMARRKLLMVDDDLPHLNALARSLRRRSDRVEIVATANGIDALVLVGSFQPHLILLDMFMPGVDGVELCRRLKKNPDTRAIDVIVFSAYLSPAVKRKAREAGATECLSKPLDPAVLLEWLLDPAKESAEASAG